MENQERNEQLRLHEQVIANMASGLYIIRVSDGNIVYANPKFERLFGYNHNELLGVHVSALNAPTEKTPEQTAIEITEVLLTTGEWHGEVKNIKKDGTILWCYADVSIFNHSSYGEVFIAVHTDITDTILTRNKLTETQLLLKASIESTKDIIFLSIDKEFKYLNFNSAHQSVMKAVYGKDVKIGMNILDCITVEQDCQLARECYDLAIEGKRFSKIDEYGSNADRLYFETDYNPIYNHNNEIIGATAFAKEITQRKKVEKALKESEERFKKLSELTDEGIVIHKDGVCIDVNMAFENITGFTKEEIIGENLIELMVQEDFQTKVYQNFKNNITEKYDFLVKRKDGNLINIQFIGRQEIIYYGDKVIVSTVRDITEDKKNELKVKKSEADLVSQIENTTDSIWSIDTDYRITITNSVFYQNFKIAFNHKLKLGDVVLDYLPEPLKQTWKERYDKAIQGDHFSVTDKFEYENVPQYVDVSFNPVTVDNKIVGVACFSRDITSQKILEEALRASEAKFKELSEQSPAAISIQQTDKFLYVNKTWENILGYSKEEALGMLPKKFIHPDFVDKILKRSDARLRGEDVPQRYNMKLISKSNETIWIDISFSVIEYENQIASLGVFFDITELVKTKEALLTSESKLKIANATKDKFFSIIAHDLRSPISSIMSLADLLNSEYNNLNETEIKSYINNLCDSSNRTYLFLEDLLTWARAQQGGIKINKVQLNLKDFVNQSVEAFIFNTIQKNIVVTNNIYDSLSIVADEYTIKTVLGNIFSNAVKFTPNGGSISMEAQEDENSIIISFADTGIGIAESDIGKLFLLDESFSTPGTNKEKGTGLGLIVCKDFVELNGGSLTVESEKGKGSTFKINLPKP